MEGDENGEGRKEKEKDRGEIRRVGKRDENEYFSSQLRKCFIRTRTDREITCFLFLRFFIFLFLFFSLSQNIVTIFVTLSLGRKKKRMRNLKER